MCNATRKLWKVISNARHETTFENYANNNDKQQTALVNYAIVLVTLN
jgi:hypothetical protein